MKSGSVALLMLLASGLPAQDGNPPPHASGGGVPPAMYIHVTSDPSGAEVYCDSLRVGITPCTIPLTRAGEHRLRLLEAPPAGWLSDVVEEIITLPPAGVCSTHVRFRRSLLILSSPSGAEVRMGDRILGTTPLLLRDSLARPAPRYEVWKRGYAVVSADPTLARRGVLTVPLLATSGTEEGGEIVAGDPFPLEVILAGGGAILAGGAAAYFKSLANDRNDRYLTTRDPALASERERYDRTAGILLLTSEVGFGLFIAFLLAK